MASRAPCVNSNEHPLSGSGRHGGGSGASPWAGLLQAPFMMASSDAPRWPAVQPPVLALECSVWPLFPRGSPSAPRYVNSSWEKGRTPIAGLLLAAFRRGKESVL